MAGSIFSFTLLVASISFIIIQGSFSKEVSVERVQKILGKVLTDSGITTTTVAADTVGSHLKLDVKRSEGANVNEEEDDFTTRQDPAKAGYTRSTPL